MISESSCSNVPPPRRGVSAVAELKLNVVVTETASFGSFEADDIRCPPFISDFADLWSFRSDRVEI